MAETSTPPTLFVAIPTDMTMPPDEVLEVGLQFILAFARGASATESRCSR